MNKNVTRAMAIAMVLAMLAGTTAFAEGGAEILTGTSASADSKLVVKEAGFTTDGGKIISIDTADDGAVVEIENERGGLRFAVGASSVILDREDGSYRAVSDLKEGMEVTVVYAADSPMGMSLPPYLSTVTAVVANADAGNVTVGHFSADGTDWVHSLHLNISDETRILNLEGAKIRLSAEDVKNQDALVFYDGTTRSIPAQTTPSLVLLLTQAEEGTASETEMQAQIMVPLREAAQENGYTVKWQGKQKPILLEKDGVSMEITLGSAEYVVAGDTMKAAIPAELRDGVTYVSTDIF